MKFREAIASSINKEKRTLTLAVPTGISATPILVVCLMVVAFLLGMLTTKIQYLEGGSKSGNSLTAAANTTPAPQAPQNDTTPRAVSVDDDPILGNAKAPVTIVEFSDYECPFCKRHFDETYAQLKTEYIDTGKVKLVFRDLPLSFHANAHKQAEAAECVRSLSDDETYFKYHDAIFTKTTSGGTGLALTELAPMASEVGVDSAAVQSCIDEGKFAAEVDKDMNDASTIGASATPSFFIGKSDASGTFTGTPIIGAYPFADFKAKIDALL